MSTLFECRWADCRKEFDDKDQYKAHIQAHVDAHEPTPIRDIRNFRRAAGFSIGSSAPQPGFDYLNNEGSQSLKAMSPDIYGISSQNHFSALGLGSQITPPISPMVQSPSLSAQIRSIRSPAQSQARAQSPMYGLAAPFSDTVTPDNLFDIPRRITPPPTAEETKLMEDMIKTPTPPPEVQLPNPATATTPSRVAAKRKQSAVKFAETTPAHKKRKVIPKTPYPDSEDDSEVDGEGSEDEIFIKPSQKVTGEIDDLSTSPFIPQSQAPNQTWDDSQEHLQEHSNLYIEEVISNGEQDELISEEDAVESQLGDYLQVEDITDPAPEHKA